VKKGEEVFLFTLFWGCILAGFGIYYLVRKKKGVDK
jgi:hypothetical protein